MDNYPYATLRTDEWLRCDGLHRLGLPTLFWDVLHHFGHTGTPTYRDYPYHEFGRGCCEVHVDVSAHPSDPGMTAWFTTATGDDLDDTVERAAHQALTEFYEGNTAWSECLAAVDVHGTLRPAHEYVPGGHGD
jgi:hypothetical protein